MLLISLAAMLATAATPQADAEIDRLTGCVALSRLYLDEAVTEKSKSEWTKLGVKFLNAAAKRAFPNRAATDAEFDALIKRGEDYYREKSKPIADDKIEDWELDLLRGCNLLAN